TVTGIEQVFGTQVNDTIVGNSSNNVLDGQNGDDILDGQGGNDLIVGGAGIDVINGGAGNDTIAGGLDGDIVNGGSGDDTVVINDGEFIDTVDGGSGFDTLDLSTIVTPSEAVFIDLSTNTFTGFGGTTTVTGIEQVFGTQVNDTIVGNSSNNVLDGQNGDDILDGQGGNDIVLGGAGNDLVIGGVGNDFLNGTSFLAGGSGEIDSLISGDMGDQDIFVLGERQGIVGKVFYSDFGDSDYAVIEDFDLSSFAGDIVDTIQLLGSAADYSISNVTIDGILSAGISFSNDLIGVVKGVNASSLNLNDSQQFTFV
ncbi:MAG: calcium-binding protein, partial [Symploca sp. SIO2G7]|nr:calcium-binding protein [Symploca sp. SIO2G7]